MDREKVIKAWECCNPFNRKCKECPYEKDCYHDGISRHMVADAVALLKEQEGQVQQWTKEIADNQLAHAPDELDRENWDYKRGIWDGLQIAWNIISEGR